VACGPPCVRAGRRRPEPAGKASLTSEWWSSVSPPPGRRDVELGREAPMRRLPPPPPPTLPQSAPPPTPHPPPPPHRPSIHPTPLRHPPTSPHPVSTDPIFLSPFHLLFNLHGAGLMRQRRRSELARRPRFARKRGARACGSTWASRGLEPGGHQRRVGARPAPPWTRRSPVTGGEPPRLSRRVVRAGAFLRRLAPPRGDRETVSDVRRAHAQRVPWGKLAPVPLARAPMRGSGMDPRT